MPILTADYSNIDYADMASKIGLKEKHVPLLIASFIEESSGIMQSLSGAIASKNFNDIRSHSHSIKGSAGNLKFNEIYEMAKEMEFAGNDSNASFEYEAYYEAIKAAIATIPQ